MRVKVEFIVETPNFGKEEFQREVEKLLANTDSHTHLIDFNMYAVSDAARLVKERQS